MKNSRLFVLAGLWCSVVQASYIVRTYHTAVKPAFTDLQAEKTFDEQVHDVRQQAQGNEHSSFDTVFEHAESIHCGPTMESQVALQDTSFTMQAALAKDIATFTRKCRGQKLLVLHVQSGKQYKYQQLDTIARSNVSVAYEQIAGIADMKQATCARTLRRIIKKHKPACVLYIVDDQMPLFAKNAVEQQLMKTSRFCRVPYMMYASYTAKDFANQQIRSRYQSLLAQMDVEGSRLAVLKGSGVAGRLLAFFAGIFCGYGFGLPYAVAVVAIAVAASFATESWSCAVGSVLGVGLVFLVGSAVCYSVFPWALLAQSSGQMGVAVEILHLFKASLWFARIAGLLCAGSWALTYDFKRRVDMYPARSSHEVIAV